MRECGGVDEVADGGGGNVVARVTGARGAVAGVRQGVPAAGQRRCVRGGAQRWLVGGDRGASSHLSPCAQTSQPCAVTPMTWYCYGSAWPPSPPSLADTLRCLLYAKVVVRWSLPTTLGRLLQHGRHIPMRHNRTDPPFNQQTQTPCPARDSSPSLNNTPARRSILRPWLVRPTHAHKQ